ncbi:tryptophan-rich sensory protein [Robertkochia marina]|uniref:Tryptophan-rich sensory protein n=1 Tax=Robertkochia marina TaxID=1227945 RepID=A0A4V3UYI5_9FLAO|nr:TspO/MBR family protein [Robertkochia marina]THD69778.1 tryptophan-rich sensory protein [Robertkochia marina]TRZ46878.1 tryptophan-rich sensory protein [Robertkochia marina]
MSKTITRISIAVVICLLVGFLSSFATQSSIDTWYVTLNKPDFNPPNWVFAPVWTLLYIAMGVAAGLVWARGFYHKWVQTALYHFGFQLMFNALWSVVFFGFQKPFWALMVILTLLILIILTIKWFRVVSKPAAWLMVPYLLWVSFATVLNFSIWWLN